MSVQAIALVSGNGAAAAIRRAMEHPVQRGEGKTASWPRLEALGRELKTLLSGLAKGAPVVVRDIMGSREYLCAAARFGGPGTQVHVRNQSAFTVLELAGAFLAEAGGLDRVTVHHIAQTVGAGLVLLVNQHPGRLESGAFLPSDMVVPGGLLVLQHETSVCKSVAAQVDRTADWTVLYHALLPGEQHSSLMPGLMTGQQCLLVLQRMGGEAY